jgi:hypothetical protein
MIGWIKILYLIFTVPNSFTLNRNIATYSGLNCSTTIATTLNSFTSNCTTYSGLNCNTTIAANLVVDYAAKEGQKWVL